MLDLIMILVISLILFSMNLLVNLIFLLVFSVLTVFWLYFNGFTTWGGVLMLVVFLTGLFVIFSYITSTVQTEKKKLFMTVPSTMLFILMSLVKEESSWHFSKFFFFLFDWSQGSFFFILFLLFVIVVCMRSTYSKGGAMRKKF